jgi:murein DD-endopeptidase MepM/ murein hydrolase activator NlpD
MNYFMNSLYGYGGQVKFKFLSSILTALILGFIIPEPKIIPVKNATSNDWNSETFWYEPWGTSGVHKGIDIFAKNGTPVIAVTNQMVLFRGEFKKGGKVIVAIGAKWRLHYYAHLSTINQTSGLFNSAGTQLGTVGASGNAKGKAPHLHYSILSLLPVPWLIDNSTQGYKKALYLNPIEYFSKVAI